MNGFDSSSFRADLVMFFGNQLPANVFDDLCKLAQDNSHGKCMSCMLPIESLILSVLHVLADAGQRGNGSKDNDVLTGFSNAKDIHAIVVEKDLSKHSSQTLVKRGNEVILLPNSSSRCSNIGSIGEKKDGNSNLGHKSTFQSQVGNVLKENINPNVFGNHRDKCSSSYAEGSHPSMFSKVSSSCRPQNASSRSCQRVLQPTISNSLWNHDFAGGHKNNQVLTIPRQDSGTMQGNQMENPIFVSDTPLDMQQANQLFAESSAASGKPHIMAKKVRIEDPRDQRVNGVNVSNVHFASVQICGVMRKRSEDVVTSSRVHSQQFGRLSDGIYNERRLGKKPVISVIDLTSDSEVRLSANMSLKENTGIHRFPVTEKERDLYNVICRLAHSKYSCNKAVEFSSTSVTYSSLGKSVEDGGKVDNFFVAVVCRKFFEDLHPRQSKKHYFYPKVGGCLYTYRCPFDVKTVERSFLGANSAYKLHLSDKLFFPVILQKHWFVFVVDIKNKQIVVLDSLFDGTHSFQIDATTKLVNAFKECWYEHAEVKLDVDCFSVVYPEVP